MIQEILDLIVSRWGFFLGLLLEHLQIALISILIAIALGLTTGVLISEFQKSSKPIMGLVNFIYTIPSIS